MARNWKRILAEGVVAGFVGYLVVVLFISGSDLLQGRSPFHTAAALGSALFYGISEPGALTVWAGPVLAYNGVHLMLFVLFGVFMAWLVAMAERGPGMWYAAALIFLIVVPHAAGVPLWFKPVVRSVLPLWMVVVGTALAAVAMLMVLVRSHPGLRQALASEA